MQMKLRWTLCMLYVLQLMKDDACAQPPCVPCPVNEVDERRVPFLDAVTAYEGKAMTTLLWFEWCAKWSHHLTYQIWHHGVSDYWEVEETVAWRRWYRCQDGGKDRGQDGSQESGTAKGLLYNICFGNLKSSNVFGWWSKLSVYVVKSTGWGLRIRFVSFYAKC